MKRTRKSILFSVIALMLSVAMLIGTTYAWFTDSVTSGKNTIVAGNLDIEMYHSNGTVTNESVDGATDLFKADYWEPGMVMYENFTVKNVGTLALKYKLQLGVYDFNTLEGRSLADMLKVSVAQGVFSGTREDAIELAKQDNKTINDFAKESKLGKKGSSSDTDIYSVIVYWEPSDNDNYYNVNNGKVVDELHNGKNELFIEFGISLVATQDTVEADSFDELYDELSTYEKMPAFKVAKGSAVTTRKSAIDNGEATNDLSIEIKTKDMVNASVKLGDAEVPAEAVEGILNDYFESAAEDIKNPPADTTIEDEIKITLNVETKSSTKDETVLDVTLFGEAKRTSTKSGEEPVITEKQGNITELDAPVLVPIMLESGLKNLRVFHTHGSVTTEMTKVAAKADVTDGKFWYDIETGEFVAKTSKFSELRFTYDTIEEVATIDNVGYASLAKAFDAAKNGDTVYLVKDSTDVAISKKNVTLNLNGKAAKNVKVENSTLGLEGASKDCAVEVGAGAMLNVNGAELDDVALTGTGEVNINSGKIEKISIGKNDIDFLGGEFHLETTEELEALKVYLADNQYFKAVSGKTGWYTPAKFASTAIARIGDKGYNSLSDAVCETKNGTVIKIIANVVDHEETNSHDNVLSTPIDQISRGTDFENDLKDATVTVDLNGKTLYGGRVGWEFNCDSIFYATEWSGVFSGVTIFTDTSSAKTGVLSSTGTSSATYAAVANPTHSKHSFVFNGGTYEGTTAAVLMNCGNLTINDGTFKGASAVLYRYDDYSGTSSNNTVTINGGTFEGDIVIEKGAKVASVVVNGGKFKTANAARYLAAGKILVEEDGYFVVKDAASAPETYTAKVVKTNGCAVYFSEEAATASNKAITAAYTNDTVYIKAAADVEKIFDATEVFTVVSDDDNHEAVWAEGKAKALEGYKIEKTDGTIANSYKYESKVKPLVAVYYANGTLKKEYATLNDVGTSFDRGDVVKALEDFTYSTPLGKTGGIATFMTFDLNGHTVTYTSSQTTVMKSEGVRFNGSSGGGSFKVIDSKGGGKLIATNATAVYKANAGGSEYFEVAANIESQAEYAIKIQACKNGSKIASGTYTGKTAAVYISQFSGGALSISGGTFNSANGSALYANAGTVNITGGTFNASNIKITGATVNISNGTFNITSISKTSGTLNITGGKFSIDPTDYLGSGYVANLVDDYYVVTAE